MHSCETEGNRTELKPPQSSESSPAKAGNLFYNLHKLVNLSEPQFPHKFVVKINLDKTCKILGTELSIH